MLLRPPERTNDGHSDAPVRRLGECCVSNCRSYAMRRIRQDQVDNIHDLRTLCDRLDREPIVGTAQLRMALYGTIIDHFAEVTINACCNAVNPWGARRRAGQRF